MVKMTSVEEEIINKMLKGLCVQSVYWPEYNPMKTESHFGNIPILFRSAISNLSETKWFNQRTF